MRQQIQKELELIADEKTRAEGTDLATLEGWDLALNWVLRNLSEEG